MEGAIWFKCVGCGKPAGYFPKQWRQYEAGSVFHTKAPELIRKWGEPSNVPCALYIECDAETFWQVNKDAERLTFEDVEVLA